MLLFAAANATDSLEGLLSYHNPGRCTKLAYERAVVAVATDSAKRAIIAIQLIHEAGV